MNIRYITAVVILLFFTHRISAEISENQGAVPGPVKGFDGTWVAQSSDEASGTKVISTLVVKGGMTADLIQEETHTLHPGNHWHIPGYEKVSPIYLRIANHSTNLTASGARLIVNWRPPQVTEWSPKTMPV